MSGIAGLFARRGDAAEMARLLPMLKRMARRGPHGQETFQDGSCLLGHRLLATDGNGPLLGRLCDSGDLAITADCRLDNREELIDVLDLPPHLGDGDILLQAYRRWGVAMPEHLLGDFAFAIWDREACQLFAARDHFGVKPFYYSCDERYFLFASDPEALFRSGLVPRQIREDGIADFLAFVAPEPAATNFIAIHRLPQGHACRISASGLHCAPYWQLQPSPIRHYADAPAEFRRLFTQAVKARLRGGPAGAMLSGGLDSSSIACVAATLPRQPAGPLPAFSMVFDATPALNERPYIEEILAKGGFAPHFIASDDVPPFAALDTILDEQSDLFLGVNTACSRRIPHAAAAAGLRVLLDGHGGDEVAPVGLGRLHELALRGHWLSLWRQLDGEFQGVQKRSLKDLWIFVRHYSRLRHLRRFGRLFPRRRAATTPDRDPSIGLMNPDFAARTGVTARQRAQRAGPARKETSEQIIHFGVITSPLQAHALELLDRSAAAAGIEPRYPFWDKRLVEFCLTLRPEEKLNNGWGRHVLRRAMHGILPPEVQWRQGKFNFMPHLATSMVRNHVTEIQALLTDPEGRLAAYLDLRALRKSFADICADPAQANGWEVQMIWRVMVLAHWLRRENELTAQPRLPEEAA